MTGAGFNTDVNHGLEKRTLAEQVYNYLRDRIVNLSLRPGERIDIKHLVDELSVSQTPIREALHKLVEQGLVKPKPYIGYFVAQLSPRDVQELFDLRKSLETLALKYVLENLDEGKIEKFLKRLDDLEREGFPIEDTQKFDEDFHLGLIIKGSGNKWLEKFANGVIDLIRLTTRLSVNPKAACVEHRKILNAVAKLNLSEAVASLEAHLERAQREAIAELEGVREEKKGGDSKYSG